jgi:hypothetical protein
MVAEPQTQEDGLIIKTVSGVDDRWSGSQALNLTYCVSTKFGTRHDDIVAAMAGGTGLWEGASSKVNFVYVAARWSTTRSGARAPGRRATSWPRARAHPRRPESGTCFEDNNWRPLTPYDSASIMH